jgi:hypothetical protein
MRETRGWYEKSEPPIDSFSLKKVFHDEVAAWRNRDLNLKGYELLYEKNGSSYQASWAR